MTENEISGVEWYKKNGRSLMCKITPGEDQQSKNEDMGEFEVQMIEMNADQVGTFFSLFERHTWWEFGDCDYD